jgi:hypothetical protein
LYEDVVKSSNKTQIHSLKLSNNDTCGQIKGFLECFSLEEFPHLQSLTLTHVRENNIDKLQAMLPLINELSCFRSLDSNVDILTEIPKPKLRKLIIPNLIPIDTISSITSLTLSKCSLHELYQTFYYAPMLTYLNVEDISSSDHPTNNMTNHSAIHLKQLIILRFRAKFEYLETFAKQTPNLKCLTISMHNNISIIDASHWENLINSSLHYLTTFEFAFSNDNDHQNMSIIIEFQQFQNDF